VREREGHERKRGNGRERKRKREGVKTKGAHSIGSTGTRLDFMSPWKRQRPP